MSYRSCLNNNFALQTIETLNVGTLTVTKAFNSSALKSVVSEPIPGGSIPSGALTTFYSKVLPPGHYSVRGALNLIVQADPLLSYTIYESSTSTKYAISQLTFPDSSSGLQGNQALPFTTFYTSDGTKPLSFAVILEGEGEYQVVAGVATAIQYYCLDG